MKVYNFKQLLEENGIIDPESSELYNIIDCLEGIGINIKTEGPWIAGGALVKTFMGEPLDSDIDIFFKTYDQHVDASYALNNYAKFIKSSKFSETFEFTGEYKGVDKKYTIQLVTFAINNKASELIESFDINVCQIAFDGERVVVADGVIDDIRNKKMKLILNKITHPGSTLKRIVKYAHRGFDVDTKDLDEFNNKFVFGYTNEGVISFEKNKY
jgi:hypothetical protein